MLDHQRTVLMKSFPWRPRQGGIRVYPIVPRSAPPRLLFSAHLVIRVRGRSGSPIGTTRRVLRRRRRRPSRR